MSRNRRGACKHHPRLLHVPLDLRRQLETEAKRRSARSAQELDPPPVRRVPTHRAVHLHRHRGPEGGLVPMFAAPPCHPSEVAPGPRCPGRRKSSPWVSTLAVGTRCSALPSPSPPRRQVEGAAEQAWAALTRPSRILPDARDGTTRRPSTVPPPPPWLALPPPRAGWRPSARSAPWCSRPDHHRPEPRPSNSIPESRAGVRAGYRVNGAPPSSPAASNSCSLRGAVMRRRARSAGAPSRVGLEVSAPALCSAASGRASGARGAPVQVAQRQRRPPGARILQRCSTFMWPALAW